MTRSKAALAGIIVVYIALGLAYAIKTPTWQTPDEPAHFNYVRDLASGRGLPVLGPGDWDAAYLDRLKAEKFPPSLPVDSVRYESHQPPLYYAIAAPVLRISQGLSLAQQVVVLRFLSVSLGAVLIALSYGIARTLFPADQLLPLAVAAFVATVPQHIATSAAVNNDTLAEVIMSAILLVLLTTLGRGPTARDGVLIGALVGLALLTKEAVYVSSVLVLGAGAYHWFAQRTPGRDRQALLGWRSEWPAGLWLLAVFGLALSIGGWWFARNALTYGGLDFFARSAHDAVVVGQPETAAWGLAGAVRHFSTVLFESFWAQFGWMGVLADERTYTVFGVLTLLAAGGCALFLRRSWREPKSLSMRQRAGLGLLATAPLLILAGLLQYNLKFMQPQGRYLFPALIPIGVFFVLGLREWVAPRYEAALYAILYAYMVYVDYISLTRFIVPALA